MIQDYIKESNKYMQDFINEFQGSGSSERVRNLYLANIFTGIMGISETLAIICDKMRDEGCKEKQKFTPTARLLYVKTMKQERLKLAGLIMRNHRN